MLISLCLSNIGIIPFTSPVYKLINKYLVPLAVPLFLFDSDLKRVIRETGTLLIAFFVGAISTIVGTLVAFTFIPLKSLGNDGWKVACALCSRHIGGAINFVAVADTLDIHGSVVSAAIAADNVVVALYFAFPSASHGVQILVATNRPMTNHPFLNGSSKPSIIVSSSLDVN